MTDQVAAVLTLGRVADWERLCVDVPADVLRDALAVARVPEPVRRLAWRLLMDR